MNVGIVHPGKMGISLAASIQGSGHNVYWASEGRSKASHARADKHRLIDLGSLENLASQCQTIISVCPPDVAEELAIQVLTCGFKGSFLDANAISPQTAINIADQMSGDGIDFVDGGIVGPPAWKAGTTWMHLSGPGAEKLADIFSSGPIQVNIVGSEIGMASALKVCFAAYTKGRTALLLNILALAEHHKVRHDLEKQWDAFWPDFVDQTRNSISNTLPRAWRFEGEMTEIADAFKAANLPDGTHRSAQTIFKSLEKYKDREQVYDIDEILEQILK